MTGTSSGLNPVVSVNGRSVGTDGAGEITLQLDARLDRARHGLDPEFQHWLTLCSA